MGKCEKITVTFSAAVSEKYADYIKALVKDNPETFQLVCGAWISGLKEEAAKHGLSEEQVMAAVLNDIKETQK